MVEAVGALPILRLPALGPGLLAAVTPRRGNASNFWRGLRRRRAEHYEILGNTAVLVRAKRSARVVVLSTLSTRPIAWLKAKRTIHLASRAIP